MEITHAIIRLAQIAEELDDQGHSVDSAELTEVAMRVSQFNPNIFIDNERTPPSQRMWKYRDQEDDFEKLDDERNKDPRYMTPEYQTMPGGESGPKDENASETNPGGLSIFDMGGRDKPIVTGPARVENEEMNPSTNNLKEFTWENTRGKWDNPDESFKKYLPRR